MKKYVALLLGILMMAQSIVPWNVSQAIAESLPAMTREASPSEADPPPKPAEAPKPEEKPAEAPKPAVEETEKPATEETEKPAAEETQKPATEETEKPAAEETQKPATEETEKPATEETQKPAAEETEKPADDPTEEPGDDPTKEPTEKPDDTPTDEPTGEPTTKPADVPTDEPTDTPTEEPTAKPTEGTTTEPTGDPAEEPTESPEGETTATPSVTPTASPSATPSATPTVTPAPDPLSIALRAEQASAFVGEQAGFALAIEGGTPPYALQWRASLDGATQAEGTAEDFDETAVSISYPLSARGSHTLRVTLTDARGQQAQASATLAVAEHQGETEQTWKKSVSGVRLTGDWREDLPAIAETQAGYSHSEKDFILDDSGVRHFYTRYGAWYGDEYADCWDAMFVSFCLFFADIPSADFPQGASANDIRDGVASRGALETGRDYTPKRGDIAFLSADDASIGIVTSAAGGKVTVIFGSAKGRVSRREWEVRSHEVEGFANMRKIMVRAGELTPTPKPTATPTPKPTAAPTAKPTATPTATPTVTPTAEPTEEPAAEPTEEPTADVATLDEATPDEADKKDEADETPDNDAAPNEADKEPEEADEQTETSEEQVATPSEADKKDEIGEAQEATPGEAGELDEATPGEATPGEAIMIGSPLLTRPLFANLAVSPRAGDVTYSVDLKYKDWSGWKKIEDPSQLLQVVGGVGQLEYTVNFVVPGKKLSTGNDTIEYTGMEGIVKPIEPISGDVKENGKKVGRFHIDENGKISIQFDQEFVDSNAGGHVINGSVTFTSSVDTLQTDNGGKVTLPFGDGEDITIYVPAKDKSTGDIAVDKKVTDIDRKNGLIIYTIDVTSSQGTFDDVILDDVMGEGLSLNGDISGITVQDGNGNVVSVKNVTQQGNGFHIELPKMEKDGKYTITYTAQFDPDKEESFKVANEVNVKSKKENDLEITHKDVETTDITPGGVKKVGKKLENGKVQWTITINEAHRNIGGWILSDIMNGVEFNGPVTILDSKGNAVAANAKLPYQFGSDSTDTYTITYETVDEVLVGDGTMRNKAILTNPNNPNKPYESEATDGTWTDYYSPQTKTGDKLTEDADGKTATIDWTVNIDTSKGGALAPWTYEDVLGDSQWFTGEQLSDAITKALNVLKGMVDSTNPSCTIAIKEENGNYQPVTEDGLASIKTDTKKYTAFKITFNDRLKQNAKGSYSYKTKASIENIKGSKEFANNAKINGITYSGKINYESDKPWIEKTDEYGRGGESGMEYTDGVLKWKITINVPAGYAKAGNSTLKMTEMLPDGIQLTSLTIQTRDGGESHEIAGPGEHTIDGQTVTTQGSGKQIDVILDDGLIDSVTQNGTADGKITLMVTAQIEEGFEGWTPGSNGTKTGVFANKVKLTDETGDKDFGESTHKHTVTNREDGVLKKRAVGGENGAFEDNTIPYEIDINPEGKDLLVGADTLTLIDVLSYGNWLKMYAYLVPGSVELCEILSDGTLKPLTPEYEYTESTFDASILRTLTVKIPDSTPLRLKYRYKVYGVRDEGYGISNKVKLEGIAESETSDNQSVNIKIQQAEGEATVSGLTLYKIDKDSKNTFLQGAEFELYCWDREADAYVRVKDKEGNDVPAYVTDVNGIIKISNPIPNVAYKLVEVTPPTGYYLNTEPYYFLFSNDNTERYPITKPVDFVGTTSSTAHVEYFKDEKEKLDLEVYKRWAYPDGSSAPAKQDSVIVGVYQYQSGSGEPAGEMGDVILVAGEGMSYQWMFTSQNTIGGGGSRYPVASYPIGTKVTYKLYCDNGYDSTTDYLQINGNKIKPSSVTNGVACFEFDVVVRDASTEVEIELKSSAWKWKKEAPEVVSAMVPTGGGEPYEQVVLSASNDWHHTFTDLPKKGPDGVDYSYIIQEIDPANANVKIDRDGNVVTVTNVVDKPQEDTTWIGVEKEWLDADNVEIDPPDGITSVQVQLYQKVGSEAKAHGAQVELNADNYWSHVFSGLPKKVNGEDCTYYVQEVNPPAGFKVIYKPKNALKDGITSGTITITNKQDDTPQPETLNLTLTKNWLHANDTPFTDPELANRTARLEVYQIVKRQGQAPDVPEKPFKTITLPDNGSWTKILSGLPKKDLDGTEYTYFVKEMEVPDGFTVSYKVGEIPTADKSDEVSDSANITVTNKEKPQPQTINLKITKNWQNAAGTLVKPTRGTVYFDLREVGGQEVDLSKEPYASQTDVVEVTKPDGNKKHLIAITVDDSGSASVTLEGLPEGKTYEVHEVGYDKDGTFTEITSTTKLPWTMDPKGTMDANNAITFTNRVPEPIQIKVEKQWKTSDGGNYAPKDTDIVTLQLYQKVKGQEGDGQPYDPEGKTGSIQLPKKVEGQPDSWKHTFENLPRMSDDGEEYVYYVKELLALSGFDATYQVGATGTPQAGQSAEISAETADETGTVSVIVVNTQKPYAPVLPATGGRGTIPYTAGGLLLMLAALLVDKNRRRKEVY